MTTLREAAQQALEALDAGVSVSTKSVLHDRLRAALAQQEQEPGGVCARCGGWVCDPVVAQQEQQSVLLPEELTKSDAEFWLNKRGAIIDACKAQGFTIVTTANGVHLMRLGKIEAKTAALAQQEQEPVADEREAMKAEYGRTDAGFTIAGIETTEGDKRLLALLVRALGSDHPAVDDLVGLLFSRRVKAPQPEPEQKPGGVCARCGGWVCDPVLKLAQQEQEPVAWANKDDFGKFDMRVRSNTDHYHTEPLWASPPRRDAPAQQEPAAWMYVGIKDDGTTHGPHLVWKPQYMDAMSAAAGAKATPLYTHPPGRETEQEQGQEPVAWVDEASIAWLTEHPRGIITTRLVLQKSPERQMPLYTTPPRRQTEQEPVAWANKDDFGKFDMRVRSNSDHYHTEPLWASPPRRAALAQEEQDMGEGEAARRREKERLMSGIL